MEISPDSNIIWKWKWLVLNDTILFTWLIMAVITFLSFFITRKDTKALAFLEILIVYIRDQIRQITGQKPDIYLPFIGTLFLFISISNLLIIIPGYQPPTGSLSTTAALAVIVFFAVPVYGIFQQGLLGYLKRYVQPSFLMLPFHIMGELSRTLALAVRLFGNIMSGSLIAAAVLLIAPFFLPVVLQLLSLLIGQIQAYIFAVLAMIYIASGIEIVKKTK